MTNFFARPEIPWTTNPEPPGFDIIRAMIMSGLMEKRANPWGMSSDWQGDLGGNELMPFAGRGRFNARQGGYSDVPWKGGGGNQAPWSSRSNTGLSPSSGSPGGGGRRPRVVSRGFDGDDMNYDGAPPGVTLPWYAGMYGIGAGGKGPWGFGGKYGTGTPLNSPVPAAGTPNSPAPATGPARGGTTDIGSRPIAGGGESAPPTVDIPGTWPGAGDNAPQPPAGPMPPAPVAGYDFGRGGNRNDFWNQPDGREVGYDGRVPYPNQAAPMPDGRQYDAVSANPNTRMPLVGGGTGPTSAQNVGAPMSPWVMPWMGDFTAPMSPEETTGLGGMSDFVTGGMGLDPASNYVNEVLSGKYIGAANPYMKQIQDAMASLKGTQDETGLRRIGSAYGAGGSGLTGARMTADQTFQNTSDANFNNAIGQMQLQNLTNERTNMQNAVGMAGNLASERLGGWGSLMRAGALPRELEQHDIDAQYRDWTRQINEMKGEDRFNRGMDLSLLNSGGYPGSHQPGYAPSAAEGWAPIVAALIGGSGGGTGGAYGGLISQLVNLISGIGGGGNPGYSSNTPVYPGESIYDQPIGPGTGSSGGYDPWFDYSGTGEPGPWAPYEGDSGVTGDGREVYDGAQQTAWRPSMGRNPNIGLPPPPQPQEPGQNAPLPPAQPPVLTMPPVAGPTLPPSVAPRLPYKNAGGSTFWNSPRPSPVAAPAVPIGGPPAPRMGQPIGRTATPISMGRSSGGALRGGMQTQPGSPAVNPISRPPRRPMSPSAMPLFDGGSPTSSFLQQLLSYLKQNPGPAGAGGGGARPRTGRPSMAGSMSPEQRRALSWMWQTHWNPGVTGRDTTPGGGNVFGGFARGGKPVGDASFLAGGNPGNRGSAEALAQLTGKSGMNDMSTWLSDIYRREGRMDLPDSKGNDPLFGDAPRFGPGSGDDWAGFFGRGSSLENIDAAVRGGGWGSSGGFGGRLGGGSVGRGGWDSANFMM